MARAGQVPTRAGAIGLVLLAGHLGVTGLLLWATTGSLAVVAAAGPTPLDVGLGLAAAIAAWTVLTWLTAVMLLALAGAALPRLGGRCRRLVDRVTPLVVRRVAATVLGLGLAGVAPGAALAAGAATSASPLQAATTSQSAPNDLAGWHGQPVISPGWTPDRPAEPVRARRQAPVHVVTGEPRATHTVLEEVVVRRGDSLWQIAARALGPGASAAEIAAEWPRWYSANRDVIGADSDLILPGQRLRPP